MSAPSSEHLLDPSRRWRVVLRHHQAGQFGAFQFGAGGVADVEGGRLLYRLVVAFGPDVESVTEIQEQQASTVDTAPAVVSPVAPAVSPVATPVSPTTEDRADRIRALRAEGRSWQQIGAQLGISRERARQLGRDAREGAASAPAEPTAPAGPP